MSSDYAPKVSGIMSRKVLGVPVIYLAAGFVLILAVYAWRTKTATPASDAVTEEPAVESFPRPSDGTVIVQSQTPPTPVAVPPTEAPAIKTNSEWVHAGVVYLIGQGVNTVNATNALQEYILGHHISYGQYTLVQRVVAHQGIPPILPTGGSANAKPATVQGTPPCTHIVKGANENSVGELSRLYYHRTDAFALSVISNANGKRTSWNLGEKVAIPAFPSPTPPVNPRT